MKKLFYICLLLLCQLTAIAQDNAKYTVTIVDTPEGSCNININSQGTSTLEVEVGSQVYIYVSPAQGYVLDTLMTTDAELHYASEYNPELNYQLFTMPNHDVTITVLAHYAPELPGNPNQTGWNEQSGSIVANNFAPGGLRNIITDAIRDNKGNADQSLVKSITVAGTMSLGDWDFVYYNAFPNLTYLDISRTTGITELDYRYNVNDNETLTTLLLPATITAIGKRAFSGFKALRNLTCFATTPPAVDVDAFNNLPKDCEVFVPAESLPLYAEAFVWKDMNLLPITQGVRKLTVNMPANADMKQMKDMYLELTNVNSGQTRRYVLTNRTQYTFTNLIEGTQYNVYTRNARENILGTIEAVNIEKKDVEVTFPALKPLRDVTLQLTAPDGSPVGTDAFITTWTDAVGNYLAKGATLPAQVEGTKAIAHVKLGQELGTQYQQPADTMIVVGNMGTVGIRLMPLPQTEITGTVTAAATGLPIRNANISVTQQLNGLYPVTLTTTTDKDGQWTLTAYAAPTTVTMQANGYVPQSVTLESLPPGGRLEGALTYLTGTTISLDLSYRSAAREGEQPTTDFSGYADISYTVYDETHQQDIADITVENGRIVLNGLDLAEGTRLRVTAKSLTGMFADATATCTVGADGKATATLPLTEYGSLIATFSETENLSVTGMLFKTSGELVARGYYQTTEGYDKPTVFFNHIPDGQYLLIIMGESKLYNSFATLGALLESGLKSKVDYVGHNIDIASGRIDSVHNQSVPTFDETVYYYTTDNTHFTVNKSNLTVGNYVTLRTQVEFKDGITPTDLQLLFDLPDGCQLVEGSVMAGNKLSTYELDGNRLTVPLGSAADIVRFCVMPTEAGYYEPTASIAFASPQGGTEGGFQPLGSVAFTADALSINTPERVSRGRVPVSGTAIADSDVKIFEGSLLIGHTEAGPDGSWMMMCSLNNAYNLSQHVVYAVITTPDGTTMQTETQTVTVSHGTVTPVVYASTSATSGVIKWDFRDNTVWPKHNAWPLGPGILPFTFKVDFYNEDNRMVNDTTLISNVVLYVQLSDDSYVEMKAPYNESLHKWVAQADFSIDASPKNVCVDFLQNDTVKVDRQEMDDMLANTEQSIAERQQVVKDIYALVDEEIVLEEQPLYDELERLFAIENPDADTQARIKELLDLLTADAVPTIAPPSLTLDEIKENLAELDKWKYQWRDNMLDMLSIAFSTDTVPLQKEEKEEQINIPLTNGVIHYTSKKETNIDEQALLSEGYSQTPMTDGTSVYYLKTDVKEAYLDTRSQMHYILEWEEGAQARGNSDSRHQSGPRRRAMSIDPIFDKEEREHFGSIVSQLYHIDWNSSSQSTYALVQVLLGQGRTLSKDLFTSAHKLYVEGLKTIKQQVEDVYKNIIDSCDAKIKENDLLVAVLDHDLKTKYTSYSYNRTETLTSRTDAKRKIKKFENLKKTTEEDKMLLDKILNTLPQSLVTTALDSWMDNSGVTDRAYDLEETPVGLLYTLRLCFYYARSTYDDLGEWQKTYQAIRNKIPCEGNENEAIALMTETIDAIASNGLQEIKEEAYRGARFEYAGSSSENGYTGHNFYNKQIESLSWYFTSWNKLYKGRKYDTPHLLLTFHRFNREKEQFNKSKSQRKSLDARINALKCKKPEPKPEDETKPVKPGKPGSPDDPDSAPSGSSGRIRFTPFFAIDFYHDPSGYVYEAVESNRLEGVKATCFYKDTKEDMYGDLYENVVLWNAEEYAQENPLFTDAEGKYRWDVPQGLWQVKYEKDGYETAYSEWLPVPPPQLEVNVGMKQLRQPAVSHVKACTDGIDITFDKYMDPKTLTTENIFVTKGGQTVDGKIELLNAEGGYASKLRFNASLTANDKLQLTIRHTVESYAGLQMEQDFTQQFDVEQRITAIVADSIVNLSEGSEYTVNVSILPAEAAKGKTLTATALTDDVVTVTPNGNGTFTLTANSLGQSAVRFCLTDDPDLAATTLVTVRDAALMYVYAPRSSRMSGTEIYRGAEIRLTCQTAGATILYTLDGSCPCDAQNANVMT
ncbi:MAG: Ig-like domain-containing protein, partial [Prevotella sp.]|nr:Ig-like domain-containing protein [Prevotella sp.]